LASLIAVADSGLGPASKMRRPCFEQRPDPLRRLGRPADDDAELSAGRKVWPAEDRRRHENLARLGVALLERADGGDAVRSHHEVDGARRERVHDAFRAGRDAENRRVLDQHRDHDVALLAQVGHAGRRACADRSQRRRLRRRRVVDRQRVSGAVNAPGHALAHAPETDEAHFHGECSGR
jgi:hypothetical protein